MITRPQSNEHAPFYSTYLDKVEGDPYELMVTQPERLTEFIEENEDRLDYAYAEGKWTIRQAVMHMVDTEQVFAYRLLTIARGDKTELPGFDQNVFIDNTDFSHLDAGDLIRVVENQRAFTFSLLNTITTDKLENMGVASGYDVSVRALIFMMAGHMEHHLEIFKERYQ